MPSFLFKNLFTFLYVTSFLYLTPALPSNRSKLIKLFLIFIHLSSDLLQLTNDTITTTVHSYDQLKDTLDRLAGDEKITIFIEKDKIEFKETIQITKPVHITAHDKSSFTCPQNLKSIFEIKSSSN